MTMRHRLGVCLLIVLLLAAIGCGSERNAVRGLTWEPVDVVDIDIEKLGIDREAVAALVEPIGKELGERYPQPGLRQGETEPSRYTISRSVGFRALYRLAAGEATESPVVGWCIVELHKQSYPRHGSVAFLVAVEDGRLKVIARFDITYMVDLRDFRVWRHAGSNMFRFLVVRIGPVYQGYSGREAIILEGRADQELRVLASVQIPEAYIEFKWPVTVTVDGGQMQLTVQGAILWTAGDEGVKDPHVTEGVRWRRTDDGSIVVVLPE